MEKPVLVILAAGMGSRYGGLKQIDPIDDDGHIIIDFSIYDAINAGFEKIVFIIKKENEQDFRDAIGDRLAGKVEIAYAFQDLNDIPESIQIPEGRVKPWGTSHAIYAARDKINGPFAVINADDFYGATSFNKIYDFLANTRDDDKYRYAMVGYKIENTVTDHGSVSRGVCETDEEGYLVGITERTRIEKRNGRIEYTEDDGQTWVELPKGTPVSMNLWGFSKSFLKEIDDQLEGFLKDNIEKNPMKCEFLIPGTVDKLLKEDKATVKVLESDEAWYGVTYKEDKPFVVESIQKLKDEGKYPQHLWN